jgi:glycosyltransferase involved in cell wall biosynthesis
VTGPPPRLSIGLPVYNGEAFLREALDDLLAQTFRDFELVISDNASTDATEAICREYAERDPRIRYVRSEENRGAAWNFNRSFELARGRYFKWAACDDRCEPTFLERCIEALESDRSVVLAYPRAIDIGDAGEVRGERRWHLHDDDTRPAERFRYQICVDHWCFHVFGVIRADVLRETRLIDRYAASDRVLLAHLCLLGSFREIEDPLFLHRQHAQRSTAANPTLQSRAEWFDPGRGGRLTFPSWRLLAEYAGTIWRTPLAAADRARCSLQLVRWFKHHWRGLLFDLRFAAAHWTQSR